MTTRRKRRPGRIANPLAIAFDNVRKLTPDEQREHLRPAREALAGLRSGSGSLGRWRDLADALNIAEALGALSIAGNLLDDVRAGQAALSRVLDRARDTTKWRLEHSEAIALDDALFVLRVQLEHCSAGEQRRAVDNVRNRISQALAGNGGPRVTIHDGKGFGDGDVDVEPDAKPETPAHHE